VRKRGLGGNFWPSRQQELLLKAALLDAEQAVAAWRALRPGFDLDHLEEGSYCLMPLISTRLPSMDPDDQILPRLKGIYRHTWYRNQIACTRMAEMLRVLGGAGFETMVLKGVARGVRYYPDLTLRPIDEVEVMVPTATAAGAIQVLNDAGWRCATPPPVTALRRQPAIRIQDGNGRPCTLRWQMPPELLLPGSPDLSAEEYWKDAVEVEIDGVRSWALDSTAELLYTCVTGAKAGSGVPVQWAADAWMILSSAGPEIPWGKLTAWAMARHCTLRLRDALSYLRLLLDAPVPADVLAELGAVHPTKRAQFAYWAGGRGGGLLGGLPHTLAHHVQATAGQGLIATMRSLPHGLRDTWELNHVSSVPLHAIRKGLRRLSPASTSDRGANLRSR
jgi:Uncharacterised nucleotidyltransferase